MCVCFLVFFFISSPSVSSWLELPQWHKQNIVGAVHLEKNVRASAVESQG